jgi:glutamate/aspartate transport system permease protein
LQDWFKQAWPGTSAYISVVVCLGLFTAARVCEQVRRHPGAARQARRRARWASACRRSTATCCCRGRIIIPPLTSEFLNIFKNSSVASLIGLMELLAQTKQTAEFSANLFEAFTLATLIYFTLNMSLMLLMRGSKESRVPGLISVGGK